MPELIIEQNKDIINYINVLKLPYNSAIQNHMVNMISGVIATEGNKTISSIYNKVTCNRDRSNGSRFLGKYNWSNDYVNHKRVQHSIKEISKNVKPETVGFLIVDDTLSKKDKSTKKIEALDYHNSHTEGKAVWSHCLVTSHYKISEYSVPVNYKLYMREKFLGKQAKKYFRNKQVLALDLIDEFMPATETTYLLMDAWYTSAKVMLHALSKGYHTIGRIKSNRVMYQKDTKTSAKDFAATINKNQTCPVTAGDETYYVYRYEGKINNFENIVVLVSWNKQDLSDKPVFILSTDVNLTTSEIIDYYLKRWDIEVSYRYHKTGLGFDEYQVESLTSIKRFWSMIFMTYTFLELFRVSNKKSLKLETLGDTIGYFRKQYLGSIVKFVYSCADKNMSICAVYSKLGIAA